MNITPTASNSVIITLNNGDRYEIHDAGDGQLTIMSAVPEKGSRPYFSIFANICAEHIIGVDNYIVLRYEKVEP